MVQLSRWTAAAGLLGSPFTLASRAASLCTSRRCYYWPYQEDFVPRGVATSRFQSSGVPRVRQEIIQQLMQEPLHGERCVVCVLGWQLGSRAPLPSVNPFLLRTSYNASSVLRKHEETLEPKVNSTPNASGTVEMRSLIHQKPLLQRCLAQFFDTDPSHVILGSFKRTKEMMLLRPLVGDAPRLLDGPHALPQSLRGVHRWRQPHRRNIAATVLLEVALEASEDVTPSTALHYGALLQSYLVPSLDQFAEKNEEKGKRISSSSERKSEVAVRELQEEEERCQLYAQTLKNQFHVVYCEVPQHPDCSDYTLGAPDPLG